MADVVELAVVTIAMLHQWQSAPIGVGSGHRGESADVDDQNQRPYFP